MFALPFLLASPLHRRARTCRLKPWSCLALGLALVIAVDPVARAGDTDAIEPPAAPGATSLPAAPAPVPALAPATSSETAPSPPAPARAAPALDVSVLGRRRPTSRGASDFQLRVDQLADVPRANASELLKLAPGILLTNEGGEGHAEQVFMRGFDAREGQDIEFTVGGVPINESGNLHGNGYADTHFIIPELVAGSARRRGAVRSAPGQLRGRRQRRLRARPRRARPHGRDTRPAASAPSACSPCGARRARARTPSAAPRSTRPTASGRTATPQRGSAMGQYEGRFGETGTLPAHGAGLRHALPLGGRAPRGRLPVGTHRLLRQLRSSRRHARAGARGRRRLALLAGRRLRDPRRRHRRSRSRSSSSSATCACSRTSPASCSTCRSRCRACTPSAATCST